MKNFFIFVLSFVFVVQISGQDGYVGRTRKISPIKPIHPKKPALHAGGFAGIHGGPMPGGGLLGLQQGGILGGGALGGPMLGPGRPMIGRQMVGGGMHGGPMHGGPMTEPNWVRDLMGKTINGKAIVGGIDGFPRHGGAGGGSRFSNGLRNGWGADPSLTMHQSVSGWADPLGGRTFPQDYSGGELILDEEAGHFIAKNARAGPDSGYIGRQRKPKPMPIGGAGGIHDPIAVQGGRRVVNQVLHDASATIDIGSGGAISRGDPFAHQAAKGLAREIVHVAGKELGVRPSMKQGVIHPKPIQPIHPKPVYPQPVHKPVMPVHKPVHQIHPKPVMPVHRPVHKIHPKPVMPVHKPVHQIHPKPVMPVHKPVHQIHPKPVMPVHKPVHQIHPKPVMPVHKPVHQIHPKPVMPVHKPVHPKPVMPVHPKPIQPIHPKPIGPMGPMHGGMGGGLLGGDPEWIRELIGSTKDKTMLVGGMEGFPRHGGAGAGERFANGLRNNWGADPNLPVVTAVSSWTDPLEGRLFPTEYNGGELIFDENAGHYIMKEQQHQVAKATGMAPGGHLANPGHQLAKAVGVAPGHPAGQIIHDVNKGMGGIGGIGGPIVDPMSHNIAKSGSHIGISSIGGLGKPLGGGSPVHNVHKVGKSGIVRQNHDQIAADIGHQSAKHLAGKASRTIDIATGGGVSHGDPFANQAALGLAREAARVTSEELALASGAAGPFVGGPGQFVQPIQPFPTGYGGRQRKRKVVAAQPW